MTQGIVTLIDSANLYVENLNYVNSSGSVASALTVTASATGTYNGSDISLISQKGIKFFVNFTTIAATCTVRLGLQAKDPLSGLYITGATASFDGLSAGNVGTLFGLHVYPGINQAVLGNEVNTNEGVSTVVRLIASITATASAGGAAVSFQTGAVKLK